MTRRWAPTVLIGVLFAVSAAAVDTVVRIDDERIMGTVMKIDTDHLVVVGRRTTTGERTIRVPADEVLSVSLSAGASSERTATNDLLLLASSERYRVKVIAGGKNAVACVSGGMLRGENEIAFVDLRGYVPWRETDTDETTEKTVTEIMALKNTRDVLMMANGDNLTGIIESVSPEEVAISAKVGRMTVKGDLVRGIAFSKTIKPYVEPEGVIAKVMLGDSSLVSGHVTGPVEGIYTLKSVLGSTWEVASAVIKRMEFRGGKLTWLSDLDPIEVRITPFFNRSWPWRRDRSVWNGPLKVAGVTAARGIGMHSRTALIYKIDGRYTTFVADIGIDDETRGTGSAVFSVSGDGRELLKPTEVTASKKPRHVKLDVTGVKVLKLLVDFGRNQDIGDHADWLNARLVRK